METIGARSVTLPSQGTILVNMKALLVNRRVWKEARQMKVSVAGGLLVLGWLLAGCSPASRMAMACPGAVNGVSPACKAWATETLQSESATPAQREQAENYLKETTVKPMPPMPFSQVQIEQLTNDTSPQWTGVTGSQNPNLCSNLGGGHNYCF
jgi:hypothetical protein